MKNYNLKRIIGAILTFIGILGLVSAVVWFVVTLGGEHSARGFITCGFISVIFFVSGVGMVQATKDEL